MKPTRNIVKPSGVWNPHNKLSIWAIKNDDEKLGKLTYLKNQLKWLNEHRDDRLSNRAKNQIENEIIDLQKELRG